MNRYRITIAVLILLPGIAHAAGCVRPDKPRFPDPKTVPPAMASKLDTAMQKYAAGTNAYVACLSKEAEAAQAEGTKTINAYNGEFLPEYNKRAAKPR